MEPSVPEETERGVAAWREILEEIRTLPPSAGRSAVQEIKRRVAAKHHLSRVPTHSELLSRARKEGIDGAISLLRRKPIRSLSGVSVVAVMGRPYPCPGRCLYCPRGEGAPQSYTGEEPAALRGRRLGYDPYLQVFHRLEQLWSVGHSTEKVELILMGGTFNAQPEKDQEEFLRSCLWALNAFHSPRRREPSTLLAAHRQNEQARSRCVGITLETRPDYATPAQVDRMLEMGITRVELGVQALSDTVYQRVGRGHTVQEVIEATRVLKDAGLKVGYHMMLGLFATPEEDVETFRRLFEEEAFRPDMVKIYPTLVLEGTGLHDLWEKGEFRPFGDGEALRAIVGAKKAMPKWVRTMRIQRDIPRRLVVAGVRRGDLGDLARRQMEAEGVRCRCIRCREVGHRLYREAMDREGLSPRLQREDYRASGGEEVFLSLEDPEADLLFAHLRLRFPSSEASRREVGEKTALVRELRVLGESLPLGERKLGTEQHRGWGALLLEEAEAIARGAGRERILVTSAVGTRPYYRRFGYRKAGPYMAKDLLPTV
jgi:elongator complex protein 3